MSQELAGLQIIFENPGKSQVGIHEAIRQAVAAHYEPIPVSPETLRLWNDTLSGVALYHSTEFHACCIGHFNHLAYTPYGKAIYIGAIVGKFLLPLLL